MFILPRADWSSMRALRLIVMASLIAPGLWSGQVSGKWKAEVVGRHGRVIALRIELKEDDGAVSGIIRDSHGEERISGGTIEGNQVTFTVVSEFHGEHVEQHYRGTIEEDIIHFRVTTEDGENAENPVRDFEAQRSSDDSPSDDDLNI